MVVSPICWAWTSPDPAVEPLAITPVAFTVSVAPTPVLANRAGLVWAIAVTLRRVADWVPVLRVTETPNVFTVLVVAQMLSLRTTVDVGLTMLQPEEPFTLEFERTITC